MGIPEGGYNKVETLGCLGVTLAQNQRSATMNPPGVAGYAGGIRCLGCLGYYYYYTGVSRLRLARYTVPVDRG